MKMVCLINQPLRIMSIKLSLKTPIKNFSFRRKLLIPNKAARKYKSELICLAASNDNQSSEPKKEELLNELRKNVLQMTAVR